MRNSILTPYIQLMRLDKPVGIWLLLFPCLWGVSFMPHLVISSKNLWTLLLFFGCGSVLLRSAGCVYNDMIDADLDAAVTRTRNRPLAAKAISKLQALLCLMTLLFLAAALLAMGIASGLPSQLIFYATGALVLVGLYPWMKRWTYWPQAFLGLTFNWGALMGGVAVIGSLNLKIILLYAAGFFWTLGYDTIYALQDIEDDALVGIKSSARRTRSFIKQFLTGCYAAMVGTLTMVGITAGYDFPYYCLLAFVGVGLAWQVNTLAPGDPINCLKRFKANPWVGAGVLAALLMGRY